MHTLSPSQHYTTTDQKYVLAKFDFLEETRGCCAGHDGFPALDGTCPLVVRSCFPLLWPMMVVAEEIGLD